MIDLLLSWPWQRQCDLAVPLVAIRGRDKSQHFGVFTMVLAVNQRPSSCVKHTSFAWLPSGKRLHIYIYIYKYGKSLSPCYEWETSRTFDWAIFNSYGKWPEGNLFPFFGLLHRASKASCEWCQPKALILVCFKPTHIVNCFEVLKPPTIHRGMSNQTSLCFELDAHQLFDF